MNTAIYEYPKDWLQKTILTVFNECSHVVLEKSICDFNTSLDLLQTLHNNRLESGHTHDRLYVPSFLSVYFYRLYTAFLKILYAITINKDISEFTKRVNRFFHILTLCSQQKGIYIIRPFKELQDQPYESFIIDCVHSVLADYSIDVENDIDNFLPIVLKHNHLIVYHLMKLCFVDINQTDYYMCVRDLFHFFFSYIWKHDL